MSKVLVTGSEGFIGGHLVKMLQRLGWTSPPVELVQIDLRTPRRSRDIRYHNKLDDVRLVYHLAAVSDARSEDVYEMMDVNVAGTARLAKMYGPKMIFISSRMARLENSPYAVSKRAAEAACHLYGSTIVRLPNVFGAGGHSVVDVFRKHAIDGTVATINGDGEQLREYISVERALDEIVAAAPSCEPLNVSGMRMTVNDVAAFFNVKAVHGPSLPFDPSIGI